MKLSFHHKTLHKWAIRFIERAIDNNTVQNMQQAETQLDVLLSIDPDDADSRDLATINRLTSDYFNRLPAVAN